jgi:hypothetical protein
MPLAEDAAGRVLRKKSRRGPFQSILVVQTAQNVSCGDPMRGRELVTGYRDPYGR